MDDCNGVAVHGAAGSSCVQIPLWTIVTRHRLSPQGPRTYVPDSSMDDCNTLHGAPGAEVETGSDSSMDDCNGRFCNRNARPLGSDSLWTIVTGRRRSSRNNKMVFRFSMDDCNVGKNSLTVDFGEFRFLYGRL